MRRPKNFIQKVWDKTPLILGVIVSFGLIIFTGNEIYNTMMGDIQKWNDLGLKYNLTIDNATLTKDGFLFVVNNTLFEAKEINGSFELLKFQPYYFLNIDFCSLFGVIFIMVGVIGILFLLNDYERGKRGKL
jgi:hypothetical protein